MRALLFFTLACLITSSGLAAPAKVSDVSSLFERYLLEGSSLAEEDDLQGTPSLRFTVSLPGYGNYLVTLFKAKRYSPTFVGLRGIARARSGPHAKRLIPASASVFATRNRISLFLSVPPRHTSGSAAAIEIVLNQPTATSVTAFALRTPTSRWNLTTCDAAIATTQAIDDSPPTITKTQVVAATARTLEIAMVYDDEAVAKAASRGLSMTDYVNSFVNTANSMIEPQLGIEVSVKRLTALSSAAARALNSPDANKLLDAFSDYQVERTTWGDWDIYHLFTGRNLDKNIIGLAYTGGVCNNPYVRFSLTQAVTLALQGALFAHEIGHNLGANHDSESSATIMTPLLSPSEPPTQFSQASITSITSHLTKRGDRCLRQRRYHSRVIGERIALRSKPGAYQLRFYRNLRNGQSTAALPFEVFGRPISRNSTYKLVDTTMPGVGVRYPEVRQSGQYAARVKGFASTLSAPLTIPSRSLKLSASSPARRILTGRFSEAHGVAPATIQIVDSKRGSVINTVTTDASGLFSTSVPSAGSYYARWLYRDSRDGLRSAVVIVK